MFNFQAGIHADAISMAGVSENEIEEVQLMSSPILRILYVYLL